MNDIEKFYDDFARQQVQSGVNRRHHSINAWLTKFGLEPHHHILEIGCGIGTQTGLLCQRITNGHITACDISPESVRIAKKRLEQCKNLTLLVKDVTTEPLEGSYDFILLPDVLEHIPISQHPSLFETLHSVLKSEGKVLIHIPDPYYLAWLKKDEKNTGKFQIIDQSIYTDQLCQALYPAGFYIEYLESYALHKQDNDYQVILLRKQREKTYPDFERKTWRSKLKGFLGR